MSNPGEVFEKKYNDGKYTGEWKDGSPHGHGKIIYTDGDMYKGEWKDGRKNGHGKIIYTDGDYNYEGE